MQWFQCKQNVKTSKLLNKYFDFIVVYNNYFIYISIKNNVLIVISQH